MKSIFLSFFVLISLNTFGQKKYVTYDLYECPLYSNIWVKEYTQEKGITTIKLRPKNKETFTLKKNLIYNKINESDIEKHLFNSLNQFRTDYGLKKVFEDTTISQSCKKYSKKLFVEFKHDENRPKNNTECIAKVPYFLFNDVTEEDGDLSKLISDACLDIFVGSPIHMSLLLSEKQNYFGIGITKEEHTISVVIRGVKKN